MRKKAKFISEEKLAKNNREIRNKMLYNIPEHFPEQKENFISDEIQAESINEIRHEIQHDIPEQSAGQVEDSDHITLSINEEDLTVLEENDEYELNMIKSADATEIRESKRSIIFNNCIFKNANFN